jgi:ADP-ribosylglycohydrolase
VKHTPILLVRVGVSHVNLKREWYNLCMTYTNKLKHQGESLIPAIAYGDAAGLPVETRSAAYIEKHYGTIDHLIPTHENPFFLGEYSPGLWSDDTQLSIAVARGLTNADGFDIEALAETHVAAYDDTTNMQCEKDGKVVTVKRGWGGSTTAAMERLKDGVSPELSGTKDGSGNGILMKMAPLIYWQVARDTPREERYEQLDRLTNMTHDSDVARLCTRIHGDVLHYLLMQDYNKDDFLALLDESITKHEFATGLPGAIRDLLGYLHGDMTKESILMRTDGKGFYAPQTLAMAYGSFVMYEGDFTSSVYEAVNLGGDTDSTASIVAAMANFKSREALVLPDDHKKLDQLAFLKKASQDLASTALG